MLFKGACDNDGPGNGRNDVMLRIGEFSALSGISINMLRHYDKIGLLVPEHVDPMSGYRYYDKEQLVHSNRIVAMKAMGFRLEQIIEAKSMNQQEMQVLLRDKLASKEEEAKLIQNQITKIKEAMKLNGEGKADVLSIVTKDIPEMWVVSYRNRIQEFSHEGILWSTLMEECSKQGIKVSSNAMAIAMTHERNDENNLDVEVMLSVDKEQICHDNLKIYRIPRCKVASFIFQGSYLKISSINTVMAIWLENNDYEISGKPFSIYHNSPRESASEESYVTELCFPIVKKGIDSRTV